MILSKNILARAAQKYYSTKVANSGFKVCVVGACGGIGQPLSLLLKRNPKITELALHDANKDLAHGVAVDLSHITKVARVHAYTDIQQGLDQSDITVICVGKPRSPGMTRSDLFLNNAEILAPIIQQVGLFAPRSFICIITNPINNLVPMAAHILSNTTPDFSLRRLFGVTTLDGVRANSIIARAKGLKKVQVPVIGGHSETTLIPAISQCVPQLNFPPDERITITKAIQNAGTELVDLKAVGGSATLSMAYAADKFINSLMEAASGTKGVVECAFVYASDSAPCEFFASPLQLGPDGISENLGVGNLIESELRLLRNAIPELRLNIQSGKDYAANYLASHKAQASLPR